MKNWAIFLILTLTVLSCKSRKALNQNSSENDSIQIQNSDKNDPKDAKNIQDRLTFYEKIFLHPKFEHVKISSKITASDLRVSPLDATIYIENDKKIWSNITFLIIPAARAIITPEGIKAMDRYNKNYIDSDFDYLNNLLNVNFIDYKTLEKLLMGRTFMHITNSNSKIVKNSEGYQLTSITNQKIVTDEVTREYKVEMQYTEDFNLNWVKLQDVKSNDAIEIVYENWETFPNEVKLPKNVKIIIKGSKTSQILMENTKFDFSRMETPYSVPANYKKIDIK
ncbi:MULTISPECIES: DUF4292 domain-containing protein [Chryseobacterium]|uniref:DUF4292 domain-containing protein n=1 Tax=Chryseobacterium TaxID=59732 RepID=UPI000C9EC6D9|nr:MULTISPECIES: DUF4292 domain-containing protein [Chryseobacterium]MBM7417656.1 hypothetical protein [Chryseobacterium sp. JUb44]MDH6211849.1 hypothetical protein [Chryseobacterium sp. BIGb0186]WSO10484.1 DUF4292 domain-containing protein [Chryseobacterium scophthalmum]VXC21785.1 conserved hypothetical protein [Chryseobacterium sp. 8AT]